MTGLALTNLDFEYELAAGEAYRPNPAVLSVCRRWQHLLRLLPEARDARCLELDETPPSGPADRLTVWGVTPRSLALAAQLGLAQEFPPLDVVREVNDKRFSHGLERLLGIELPHSRVVSTVEQLRSAIADCPFDWVLKHPFGVSARERAVGKRGRLSDSGLGWAHKRFAEGWSLVFEPWVWHAENFSLHFEVGVQVRFLGHCQLVTDASGVYRGNRVTPGPPGAAFPAGLQVAERLAAMGYVGAVGMDGLAGRLGERHVLRPLVEINARQTFGRLALALAEWIPAGWSYLWWHPSPAEARQVSSAAPPLPGALEARAGLYSLPTVADPAGASGTFVLMESGPDRLRDLEARLGVCSPGGDQVA